eukprot:Anaeramoba_ignava/a1343_88.p1 GENE.a1343_88~~a1343_88.p1  ORF type:complete len:107 (+),score=8.49 a1343_88:296-616(+)
MAAAHVNDANFDQVVLNSDIPVLVDLWAPWCGPCKALTPTIDELAVEMKGKVNIVKVNVDESPQVATKFQVMSIPTLLLFKDGQVQEQIIGLVPKAKIEEKLNQYI